MSAGEERKARAMAFTPSHTVLEAFPALGIPEVKRDDAHRLWSLRVHPDREPEYHGFDDVERCAVVDLEDDPDEAEPAVGLKAIARIMRNPLRVSQENRRRRNRGRFCDGVVIRVTLGPPTHAVVDIPIWRRPLKRGSAPYRRVLESAMMVQESFAQMMSGGGHDQTRGDTPL